jgi:hypothetical protein
MLMALSKLVFLFIKQPECGWITVFTKSQIAFAVHRKSNVPNNGWADHVRVRWDDELTLPLDAGISHDL